jgi:predicted porin
VGVAPEADEHEHGHEASAESAFEPEGALFDDTFVVANWTNNRDYNDFHQFRFGASGAWGDNRWGRTTQIYGVHGEYQWRENGYEAGGRYLRWRNEAMVRSFDAVSGHLPGEEPEPAEAHEQRRHGGSFDEFGIYSALAYGFENGLELGLRGEFVSGIADAGLDERFRVSPAVTYYFNKNRTFYLRGQYNFDHSSDFGNEHSVFAQVGVNWGGPEVR